LRSKAIIQGPNNLFRQGYSSGPKIFLTDKAIAEGYKIFIGKAIFRAKNIFEKQGYNSGAK
jgi:hypothetical protein